MTVLSAQSIRYRCGRTMNQIDLNISMERSLRMKIEPFCEAQQVNGMSYGLSSAGYDIRVGKIDRRQSTGIREIITDGRGREIDVTPVGGARVPAQEWKLRPQDFLLCSSLEYFEIPHDVIGFVCDKSTLARKGLALQNTVLEPGWRGFITLELSYHSVEHLTIRVGQPIGQVVFQYLDFPTVLPYEGKYQDAPNEPQHAISTPEHKPGDS